jgi:TLD
MRHSRTEKTTSILDQAHRESEIDVFPYTGENSSIQLCTSDMIAVGSGSLDTNPESSDAPYLVDGSPVKDHEWGFGLTVSSDLITGTSSPSATFANPPLSTRHRNGERFEIMNLELWSLTPCVTLEEAEKLELAQLFLQGQRE